jgi:hypothetical protein
MARLAAATPNTDTKEIKLMAFCDFFENRYRAAMKIGHFIGKTCLIGF